MIQNVSEKFRAPPVSRPFAKEPLTLPTPAETLQAPPPDPENAVRIVDRRPPWDIRLLGIGPTHVGWVERQIRTPRPIRRFILWSFRWLALWYSQARMLVVVLRSPEVTESVYQKRQEMCGACEENVDGYCRACVCPKWRWVPWLRQRVKLVRKNLRAGWKCPAKPPRHPGEYTRYGCPGCGKSHANNAPQNMGG